MTIATGNSSRHPTADLQAAHDQARIQLGKAVTSGGLCYAVWLAGTGPLGGAGWPASTPTAPPPAAPPPQQPAAFQRL